MNGVNDHYLVRMVNCGMLWRHKHFNSFVQVLCNQSYSLVIVKLISLVHAVGSSDPLFSVRSGSPPSSRPLTFHHFSSFLARVVAVLGLDSRAYLPHSFPHGSTTFAFECNVPAEHIKFQGDWSSDAYYRSVILLCLVWQ